MVKFVENELLNIKTEVNDMWQLVYQQLNNAYKSVLEVNMELADKVILREKRVNAFELRIDSDIEDLIALYNPVAVDLRFALAMLKSIPTWNASATMPTASHALSSAPI